MIINESKGLKAIDVANYMVHYCWDNKTPICNLQLQKILYLTWIDYYKETHKYLFNDYFRAWSLGPVVIPVYNEYCTYGGMPIRPLDIDKHSIDYFPEMESILDRYRTKSTFDLVGMTTQVGGAWDAIYEEGKSHIIPFELIIEKGK